MNKKTLIGIAGACVFLFGAGNIVYSNRPIMKLQTSQDLIVPSSPESATSNTLSESSDENLEETEAEPSTKDDAISPTQNPAPTAQTPPPSPAQTEPTPTKAESSTPPSIPNAFSLADVAKHATASDCWSAIRGNVYDLSSWVSRHPGGPQPIIGLCVKDGTQLYENAHGDSKRPASMLILLKIGSLK